jgi:hypothetical protein
MNNMMNMALRLNISVLYRNFESCAMTSMMNMCLDLTSLFYIETLISCTMSIEQYDEHGTKIEEFDQVYNEKCEEYCVKIEH